MRAAGSWAIVFGSLIAAVASGCSSDGDFGQPPGSAPSQLTTPVPTLVLGPQVYLVPSAAGAQLQSDRVVIPATAALTPGASGPGKLASDLVVGDFMINDYGSPGFMRAVTAVSTTAGVTTAMTRRAGLDEVLQTGSLTEVVPNLASGGTQSALARPQAIPLPPFDIPITLPTTTLGNVTVDVKSGSHLAFDPELDVGLELGLFSVNEFHAILRGALTGRLELEIHAALAQGQLSFEHQVFQAPDVEVPLPPTPLVLTARLRVLVGCSVQADATVDVDTGFTLSGSLTAGAHFRNGTWGADANLPTFTAITPSFGEGASLHASCELRPRLELLVEGVIGPFVDVVPSVYGDVAFQAPPAAVSWGVGWTLTGGLGGTLDVLFHQFNLGPVTIFDIGKQQLAGGVTQLGAGYCNANPDCPSGQSCSSHHCVAIPPPPPPADNCAHALNGAYCGYSTADGFSGHGDGHTIYDCSAHRTTATSHCSTNCVVAPSGHPDTCAPAANNCSGAQDGGYCGNSAMDGFSGLGDAHTIYFCSHHSTTSTTHCSNACIIAPPGQADYCSSCGGTVCGSKCCGAGDWCGAGNKCCSGCSPGCPC